MILFYTPHIENGRANFPPDEAKHCVQVLRKRPGEVIRFADGRGHWHEGPIISAGKKELVVGIEKSWPEAAPAPLIHIAIAPPKNTDRFEWFLEKATEIGIGEITPLVCEHSGRSTLRSDRLQRVLVAAMKQSMRATLPALHALTPFSSFVKQEFRNAGKYIAHCRTQGLPHLFRVLAPGAPVVICIGPEGDFSTAEIVEAQALGFVPVGLGTARLRSETAGVVACLTALMRSESGPETG